jgi:hypothetical protein
VVHWPSGTADTISHEKADQDLVVREGQGVVARHMWSKTARLTRKSRKH